ncbi:MAG TPA: M48 family metalloprotease [Candidatus Saccharimonadales bacterium]|jgi:heat shock protein HtpX|nr:M48 family metalloprotease [Candidatus Saccharimonadales bacterium]
MYSDIASNKRKTVIIMAVFMVFLAAIVWIFAKFLHGGTGVFYGGLIGSLVYIIVTYYAGAKMALAVNSAHEIQKSDNPRLWRVVENLAITDGLAMPRVYIMNDPAPNAFATGRDPKHATVCVTSGLLQIMDDNELQGVIAHELGHVKNYDIRVSMVAFALTSVISLIADIILRLVWFGDNDRENNQVFLILGIVAAILAPIVATMIQLAVSRQREYLADATGALTTRYPEGLASALEKIQQTGSVTRRQNTSTAHLFFANPLKKHGLTSLFDTHPPIADRIARLRNMDAHA